MESAPASFRWWMPGLVIMVGAAGLVPYSVVAGSGGPVVGSPGWWAVTALLHLPMAVILFFQAGGLVERVGYFWRGRAPAVPGRLPAQLPSVGDLDNVVAFPHRQWLLARRIR